MEQSPRWAGERSLEIGGKGRREGFEASWGRRFEGRVGESEKDGVLRFFALSLTRGGRPLDRKHREISTPNDRDGFRAFRKESSVRLSPFRPRVLRQRGSPVTGRVGVTGGVQQRWSQVQLADHLIDASSDAAGRAGAGRLPEELNPEPLAAWPARTRPRWSVGRFRMGSDLRHDQSGGRALGVEALDELRQVVRSRGA